MSKTIEQLSHPELVPNTQPIVTETTIFAEPIFHVGSFTITNSLLNTWMVVFVIVLLTLTLRSKVSMIPKGIQNAWDAIK